MQLYTSGSRPADLDVQAASVSEYTHELALSISRIGRIASY